MNDNNAIVDYESESKSAQSVSDDTQNTDFTQVACSIFEGEPESPDNRQARTNLINENIAMETDRSFSLKHFLSRLFGLK